MRRREELVGAARRVIGRDGFAAATVGEITREAGASLGLLNYHFGSKDEVVAEAFAEAAREELRALEAISRRFEDPADRLAAYLGKSEWADVAAWRMWVDAWGESVHSGVVRDTLGRFEVGWRAVLAEVLTDGVRHGCWECDDVQDTAARLVAVIDGIGLHTTLHGEDVPPERAAAWARRLVELELGVTLPAPPSLVVSPPAARVHFARIEIRARDLDAHGHVDPAVRVHVLGGGALGVARRPRPGRDRQPRRRRLPAPAGTRAGDGDLHARHRRSRELPDARDGRDRRRRRGRGGDDARGAGPWADR